MLAIGCLIPFVLLAAGAAFGSYFGDVSGGYWGAGTGFLAGSTAAVPPAVARPALGALLRAAAAPAPPEAALNFFAHNLLAIVVAALLAGVTAGVSGFLVTFLPGFLLGYAAALSSWALALHGILPNGLVEIPAAIVAGGLAVQVGAAAIHMERAGGWSARVAAAYADLALALRWVIPALAAAAVLEAYWG